MIFDISYLYIDHILIDGVIMMHSNEKYFKVTYMNHKVNSDNKVSFPATCKGVNTVRTRHTIVLLISESTENDPTF